MYHLKCMINCGRLIKHASYWIGSYIRIGSYIMSKNLIRKETRRAYTADVARTPPDSERRTPGTAPIEPKSVSIAAIALPVAIDDSVVDKRKTTEQHTPGQSKSMARSTSKHRGERPRIAHAYHTHIHAYHTHSTRTAHAYPRISHAYPRISHA